MIDWIPKTMVEESTRRMEQTKRLKPCCLWWF